MEKAIVMNKAWDIAREGVNKFGGQVKEYFSKALKIAWSLIKKEEKQMIELKGSEKQIKWANDIRENAIEKIGTVIKEIEEWANLKRGRSMGYAIYVEIFEEMKDNDSARFWIDVFGYKKTYKDFIVSFDRYVEMVEGNDHIVQRMSMAFIKADMLDAK